MNAELLKGHLDLLLLSTLVEPAHGYAIIDTLRRTSDGTFDLPEGTVYVALHRLEQAGLLTSRWATVAGRRRRVYALTHQGRASLDEKRAEWARFVEGVSGVLRGTQCRAPA
ncbi:MAG TPA: helix-turn-helix transcriptional regulator [Chloroflexota bacterium]|nr:helix-turn-helix transcriptional regulator [Chloroflexota bacterium]